MPNDCIWFTWVLAIDVNWCHACYEAKQQVDKYLISFIAVKWKTFSNTDLKQILLKLILTFRYMQNCANSWIKQHSCSLTLLDSQWCNEQQIFTSPRLHLHFMCWKVCLLIWLNINWQIGKMVCFAVLFFNFLWYKWKKQQISWHEQSNWYS